MNNILLMSQEEMLLKLRSFQENKFLIQEFIKFAILEENTVVNRATIVNWSKNKNLPNFKMTRILHKFFEKNKENKE